MGLSTVGLAFERAHTRYEVALPQLGVPGPEFLGSKPVRFTDFLLVILGMINWGFPHAH